MAINRQERVPKEEWVGGCYAHLHLGKEECTERKVCFINVETDTDAK